MRTETRDAMTYEGTTLKADTASHFHLMPNLEALFNSKRTSLLEHKGMRTREILF
jgi:hypothetical protein